MKTLIVGFGIAGLSLVHQLRRNNISFHVIDSPENSSSLVAGGVLNPTVLKRYNMSWKGKDFSDYALSFYQEISNFLNYDVYSEMAINRIFPSPKEHNKWSEASDKHDLNYYLNKNLTLKTFDAINTPYGIGTLKNVGRLDFKEIILKYREAIKNDYKKEEFQYSKLKFNNGEVIYNNDSYDNIVFCEGYSMKNNPFFNYLPLTGSKGEMLIIRSSMLSEKSIWKSKFFIVPLGQSLFWVGATFNHIDKTTEKSLSAKNELLSELNQKLNVPFEVVGHEAQIRPTVSDRRPLLGSHYKLDNLYIFNGLGTRGSLMAPRLSEFMYNYIFSEKALPTSIDIRRFTVEKN
tara:strand:+ start:3309 stop:4349 length:1041 start_codon:yes stop_codon:yes gene_type:complete